MFQIFKNDEIKKKNMKKERAILKITIMLIGMDAFFKFNGIILNY